MLYPSISLACLDFLPTLLIRMPDKQAGEAFLLRFTPEIWCALFNCGFNFPLLVAPGSRLFSRGRLLRCRSVNRLGT